MCKALPPNLLILKNYCFHFSKFSVYYCALCDYFVCSIGRQPYREANNFVSYNVVYSYNYINYMYL